MEPKKEIILRDGQFISREVFETNLGTQASLLASLSTQDPVCLQNFCTVGTRKLHVLARKDECILLTELTELPFDAWWNLEENGVMVCHYDGGNNKPATAVKINDSWILPKGLGKILFAVHFKKKSSYVPNTNWQANKCYLAFHFNGENRTIPYPNIYETGQICMGLNWENELQRTNRNVDNLAWATVHYLDMFLNTPCSSHLIKSATIHLFKRDLDKWIYPVTHEAMARLCPITGNTLFQGLIL